MTIAIPGTTIDVRDIKDGGTFVYGAEYSAFPPMAVRQAEAKIVDNMVPLSNIMVKKHFTSPAIRLPRPPAGPPLAYQRFIRYLHELETAELTRLDWKYRQERFKEL